MCSTKNFMISKNMTITIKERKLFTNDSEYKENDEQGKPKELTPEYLEEVAIKKTREHYSKLLTHQYENLIILSGSGTSCNIGTNGKVGKTITQIWKEIDESKEFDLKEFCELVNYYYYENNLENLLSYSYKAKLFYSKDDTKKEKIETGIEFITEKIKELCSLNLPENSPHEILINKIIQRPLKYPRVKLFTLNYDTLFEQATQSTGTILLDGFSINQPRTFRGQNFDFDFVFREKSRIKNEQNFLPKVIHLYKIHGSIDWESEESNIYQRANVKCPLIILPNEEKFEHSFEQPYFEMVSRFIQYLRKENTLLIVLGFSFFDKHITNIIKESIKYNSGFQLMIVDKDIQKNDHIRWFFEKAGFDYRITILQDTFEEFTKNYPENNSKTEEEKLKELYDE